LSYATKQYFYILYCFEDNESNLNCIYRCYCRTSCNYRINNECSVLGIPFPGCLQCAKDFAPGQEKKAVELNFDSGAKAFVQGQEAKVPAGTCTSCNGKEFAPGQEKKDIGVIGQ
jgi:hypothetical protein